MKEKGEGVEIDLRKADRIRRESEETMKRLLGEAPQEESPEEDGKEGCT